MNETMICAVGNVATQPVFRNLANGPSARFRLAVTARYWDREKSAWTDGHTNFFTVWANRQLAANASASLAVGEPVIVQGPLEGAHGRPRGAELDLCGHRRGGDRSRPGARHGGVPSHGEGGDGGLPTAAGAQLGRRRRGSRTTRTPPDSGRSQPPWWPRHRRARRN